MRAFAGTLLLASAAAATGTAGEVEKDRQAIRAMAGAYKVEFNFMETVPLAQGYQAKPPKRSGATELMLVIEDAPRRIELQHILVMRVLQKDGSESEPFVTRHWRQEWRYEAESALVFEGSNAWTLRKFPQSMRRDT